MNHCLAKILILAAAVPLLLSQQRPEAPFSPYVDGAGKISRPKDYRRNWAHLGTYFVIGDSEGGHSMHSVYTERCYLDAYNENGEWSDGAVIVKEVFRVAGAQLTTGASNWAAEPEVWFVVVKDREERFPDNPLWGDGWGWALFKSDEPDNQVAADYRQDCLGCHLPAKATDFVYIQGYPPLRNRPKTSPMPLAHGVIAAQGNTGLETGSAERGAAVFRETCSFCHTAEGDQRKTGPGLAVIAREGRLPSGRPASPENILNQINRGGGGMPAFAEALEAREKADVIAFLRSAR